MNIFGRWLRLSFCWIISTHLMLSLTRKISTGIAKLKIVAHLSAFEDHSNNTPMLLYKSTRAIVAKLLSEQIEPIKNSTNHMKFFVSKFQKWCKMCSNSSYMAACLYFHLFYFNILFFLGNFIALQVMRLV